MIAGKIICRRSTIALLLLLGVSNVSVATAPKEGPHREPLPRVPFVSIQGAVGRVFPSAPMVRGDRTIWPFGAYSIRFGWEAALHSREAAVYGKPYWGAGVEYFDFHRPTDIGRPWSLYLLQGGRIVEFTPRLGLNYEWNLGVSFNWRPYDPFTNPENVLIGSSNNVHFGGQAYLNWRPVEAMQLNLGVAVTHFSSGSTRQPNKGLNVMTTNLGMTYSFGVANKEEREEPFAWTERRRLQKKIQHDLLFVISGRRVLLTEERGVGLPTPYSAQKYRIYNLSYHLLFHPHERFRWGPGANLLYDEAAGVKVWSESLNGSWCERQRLEPLSNRLSAGFFVQGEFDFTSVYSAFLRVGYNLYRGASEDSRLYQVLGVKVYCGPRIFGVFGVQATHFNRSQFFHWGMGCSWNKPNRRRG